MSPPQPSPPTHPRPRCGRVAGGFRGFRVEHLRHPGWQPYQVVTYVNWCGHGQAVIPWPQADGSCQLIPVLGTAR